MTPNNPVSLYIFVTSDTPDLYINTIRLLRRSLPSKKSCISWNGRRQGSKRSYKKHAHHHLLTQGFNDIFVFELRLPKRTFDERELIHNLSLDRRDYEYVNITRSRYTNGTIVKSKGQEEQDKALIIDSNKLIDTLAERFAKSTIILYGILVFSVFIWCILFILQGGWDQLEPLVFLILTLVPYLTSILLAVFSEKEFSLNPILLSKWLKEYRSKSLRKKR